MKILFVHQNFPGQYKHLLPAVIARGDEVVAMGMNPMTNPQGFRFVHYRARRGNSKQIHPWVVDFESKIIRGEACAHAAMKLKQEGFEPDIICAHPGWGEALFLKDVWPDVPILGFFEFYYLGRGGDYNFDPEFPGGFADMMRVRAKNAGNLLSLEACDAGICPTEWQKAVHPEVYRPKLSVIHDGIDTDNLQPNPEIKLSLGSGASLSREDEVITFVNRNLEPYRGWHAFARALPEILARRPKARVLIVGGDETSYGARPRDGVSHRKRYWSEVVGKLDASRVHFLGKIPYNQFIAMLQLSSVHVYLTYPFVLSWSMLEAMSCGALVVGSRTPPVEEVIRDGENGLLVDFFNGTEMADAIDRVLDHPDRMQALREAARRTAVERYDLKQVCLPAQLQLLDTVIASHAQKRKAAV